MTTIDYFDVYQEYIVNDLPIPYKNIKICPIYFKDAYKFLNSYDILNIEKDEINDVNIIQMSYLKFILLLMQSDTEDVWAKKINNIFELCLNMDDFIHKSDIEIDSESDTINIRYEDIVITERDFDIIRKIILYQNLPNYDDIYIDPDVKKSIETYYKLANENINPPTIEKKKIILMTMGLSSKEIFDLTYREAELLIDTVSDKIEYTTNKIISAMPYVDGSKINVDNWIYKKKKNKYEDAFVDAEAFKDKFKNVSQK